MSGGLEQPTDNWFPGSDHRGLHALLRWLPILAGAFLSGVASLCYEVVWSRALVVPLGNSNDAGALVLCGFMLGIAVGAHLGGQLSERVRSPLLAYAFLEAALAPYGLLAPTLFASLSSIGSGSSSLPLGLLLRHGVALTLVVLPCLATGATFPLLVRAMTTEPGSIRLRVGIAYAVNTAGAATGAIASGFWALPALGLRICSSTAAGAQVLSAAFLVLAHFATTSSMPTSNHREAQCPARHRARASAPLDSPTRVRKGDYLALAAAFLGGFVMLACEALWARVLTFVFGHDTYAFSALLAVVLVGLALGALVHRLTCRVADRELLGWFVGSFAVSVLASFWLAGSAIVKHGRDPLHIDSLGTFATSAWIELYRELAFAPILVLLPSVFAGAVYATACSAYGRERPDTGRSTGVVALTNGIGSALGVFAYAVGLVPWLGIQRALVALASLCAVLAGAAFLSSRWKRNVSRAIVCALLPGAAVFGVALAMPQGLPRSMLLEAVGSRHQDLLFYEEARTGTISVISNQLNGERQLVINAVNEVTTRLVHDQSFKLLGHLGPLLHPNPKNAVMICLGAGLSAGAALTHSLERMDVVDLSSAVARGARRFEVENHAALDDPRLHLHIDDGRQFLLNAREAYDVAIIDSTHPKAVDSWILYTKEFYELVRARMTDDGVVVQWLPLHGLSEREFRIVVRTFREVFPEMTLWANAGFETYGQVGYAKLVGLRRGELSLDYGQFVRRLAEPRIRDDLVPFGMDRAEEVLDLFVASHAEIDAWTHGLPVQTDDHPILPYTTPYSTGPRMTPVSLLSLREPAEPYVHNWGPDPERARADLAGAYETQGLVLAGMLERASALAPGAAKVPLFVAEAAKTRGYYTALANTYRDDPNKLFECASQLASMGHIEEARLAYQQGLALRPKDLRLRLGLALVLSELGEHQQALSTLRELRAEAPRSALVQYDLGAALLAAGDAEAAASYLRKAVRGDPDLVGAALLLVEAEAQSGEHAQAQKVVSALVQREPWIPAAFDWLGRLAEHHADHAAAAEYHRRAKRMNPYRAEFRYRLALALDGIHDSAHAEAEYLYALRLAPNDPRAFLALGRNYLTRGMFDQAVETLLHVLELSPNDLSAARSLGDALRGKGDVAQATGAYCLALRLGDRMGGDSEARARLIELGMRPDRCGDTASPQTP